MFVRVFETASLPVMAVRQLRASCGGLLTCLCGLLVCLRVSRPEWRFVQSGAAAATGGSAKEKKSRGRGEQGGRGAVTPARSRRPPPPVGPRPALRGSWWWGSAAVWAQRRPAERYADGRAPRVLLPGLGLRCTPAWNSGFCFNLHRDFLGFPACFECFECFAI